ncbi:MFS transporter [[Phormidium ambiguum] IAM M-71]|uniref:MFS transporter n=1 Tax=[Phormidium ambiguum] IAM M-71 TaxID=454136 RepID=A0A1U7ITQ9_9CYAN|nr:ABC transporter ATP-binding protein [Phormidium ambiguum]OKH40906.1 MFS transporter [Phormidium ambiguum IAM M-71]
MIEVENLTKIYGASPAIQDVSFAVEPGEIVGFLGPNGAGKTTTMRILAGYLPATSGTARIAGYDVHEDSMAVRQRIGYLPELPPLYPDMTVEGFLYFVSRIKGVSAGDRADKVNSALKRCNLEEKRQVLIRKLSKGFRQRVGIAQAIVHDPPAIILDEPTVGLDPRQIIEMRNLIKSLAGSHTIILSTHILPEVSMTCSRVTIINRGKIVAINTPENLEANLVGGTGYELEIAGDSEEILQKLRLLTGVSLVESVPVSNGIFLPENHGLYRVVSEPGVELGKEITAVLVASDLGLYEMRRTRASLEEVFLKLTTTEKIDTAEIKRESAENPELETQEGVPDLGAQDRVNYSSVVSELESENPEVSESETVAEEVEKKEEES